MSTAGDSSMAWVKGFFKKYPRLYHLLVFVFGVQPMNTTVQDFVRSLPLNARILNIGSGPRVLRTGVINIDIAQFEGVDVVADAEHLPFPDHSADAAILDNVLEHVRRPDRAVVELLRVLKPGGRIYVATPFVMVYHSSPDDFYRFSAQGLRELLRDFHEEELKIQYGPTAAFAFVFCEWLALTLSFNTLFLYTVVLFAAMIVTTPLKFLDYLLVHYKRADNLPNSFYFIGRKK